MKLIEFIPLAAMMKTIIIAGLYAYNQISAGQCVFLLALCVIYGIWAIIDIRKEGKHNEKKNNNRVRHNAYTHNAK